MGQTNKLAPFAIDLFKCDDFCVCVKQGRTFRGLIQNFLGMSKPLNSVFLPIYNTDAGRHAYEKTLKCVRSNFPQYVRELEGTAEGAQVPFHKVGHFKAYNFWVKIWI